ncbi:MAG: histidine triad nucleotide-binding protein [Actinomycetota bacterium]|nr:histidine triad nucleotide-binding protein [Actinomycetota bacterium]|tara:strand:- start:137 stop:478 length:342 start_codon:yes stop_codon:yes gene_type:complete
MEEKSIFQMILDKEIESEIIYEDEKIFSIQDINPAAKVHLLIIPKKRINTINDLENEDKDLIGSMVLVAKELAKRYEIEESGYRLVWNTNSDGGQTVFHIHLHLLGGEKLREF